MINWQMEQSTTNNDYSYFALLQPATGFERCVSNAPKKSAQRNQEKQKENKIILDLNTAFEMSEIRTSITKPRTVRGSREW